MQILDPAGHRLVRLGYDVFGKRVDPDDVSADPPTEDVTRGGFSGSSHDDEIGLIDMNGRLYDAVGMRFTSPDPMLSSPFDPRGYNRYAYAWNNPLAFRDPTGFETTADGVVINGGEMIFPDDRLECHCHPDDTANFVRFEAFGAKVPTTDDNGVAVAVVITAGAGGGGATVGGGLGGAAVAVADKVAAAVVGFVGWVVPPLTVTVTAGALFPGDVTDKYHPDTTAEGGMSPAPWVLQSRGNSRNPPVVATPLVVRQPPGDG